MSILMDLLLMLGGIAVFMFGMKQMSTGLEQSAGTGIRNLFKKLDKNSFVNYLIGVGSTVLVQSSSATSIMTVGLAHAGIVTVNQGAGFILGSKVGTTLTAFFFALSGLSKGGFSISAVFAAFAFVGVMIIFSTENATLNKIAPFLIGFGMLFIGMEVMEIAIGGADSALSMELSKVFKYEIMQSPILLVILGILFTSIIQSSTAATGVFIAFLSTGVIQNIDQSFFLVMGANIGTCSDGIMASLTTNANGKRIALFHLVTSTIGAVAFTVILMILRNPIISGFEALFAGQPQFSLATYNLIYNLIYTLVLLSFIDPLVNFVTRLVKDKEAQYKEVLYIHERFLNSPSVAIEQVLKEIVDMATIAMENVARAFSSLINEDMSESKEIANIENRIDYLTGEITSFLIKISSANKSVQDEKLIGGLHHVANDIERIGDYSVLIVKETNYLERNDLSLNDQTKRDFIRIYEDVSELFDLGLDAFRTNRTDNFEAISQIHQETRDLISTLRDEHVVRLSTGVYPVELSKSIYSVLFSLERISDHIVNIAFSIRSTTGSKTEAMQVVTQESRTTDRVVHN